MSSPYNIGGDNYDNSGLAWDVLVVVIICLVIVGLTRLAMS